MINTRYFMTREDGVKLVRTVDALVDENNKVILDENENAVMRGFYIRQNETNEEYDETIDVENSQYTYSETNKAIETEEINHKGGI